MKFIHQKHYCSYIEHTRIPLTEEFIKEINQYLERTFKPIFIATKEDIINIVNYTIEFNDRLKTMKLESDLYSNYTPYAAILDYIEDALANTRYTAEYVETFDCQEEIEEIEEEK